MCQDYARGLTASSAIYTFHHPFLLVTTKAHGLGFPPHICRFLVRHLLLNARTPRALSLYDFDCHFDAKCPQATTSSSAALIPPSGTPFLPWAPDPFAHLLPGLLRVDAPRAAPPNVFTPQFPSCGTCAQRYMHQDVC